MTTLNVDDLTSALAASTVSSSGVSFCGKSLKLDTAEDAKEIVEAINNCPKLEYLNLEGNTLGVEAAKAIAKALESHPELKRALWKDMFTGRMKSEIPLALEHLGKGLVVAGARLTEIDLSDNAFGPIGVKSLAALLRSSCCYNLQELRLNNNGLGISGGKLLASALMDCYTNSKSAGKPLSLRVFIAGRNRLENDGAKALAQIFQEIGSLEEVSMPQNGIYHIGITALSNAFTHNKNLQSINLNDNTIGPKGAQALAQALPNLQNLKQINFGDCLLKTKGALHLANALKAKHLDLEELILDQNEINVDGAMALAKAIENKTKLKQFTLNGNTLGSKGRSNLEQYLIKSGQITKLMSLSDDESEDDDDDDESDDNDDDAESVQSDDSDDAIQLFLEMPNEFNFIGLGDNKFNLLKSEAIKMLNELNDETIDSFMDLLMNISSLTVSSKEDVSSDAKLIVKQLYKQLFEGVEKQLTYLPLLNNSLLTHLCLIKSEDKKFKPKWNLNGCFLSLQLVMNEDFFLQSTKNVINAFSKELKEEKITSVVDPIYIKNLQEVLQQS